MSHCPDVDSLLAGADATHLSGCAACRAVVSLADQHRAGADALIDCADVDAWLTAQLLGGEPDEREDAIREHILECAECRIFAKDVEGPGTADTLFDLGAIPAADFTDLRVVAVDNYARGTEIGRGGMGRIVRARDRRLGRSVAIKELLNDKLRARFEREARLTARLQHPAIVNVHEAGLWPSGAPFYVMKYVAGEPLAQRIARTRTLGERLALLPNVITVVEALAYAHSERIIHRDLKPANILVGPFGETVVIDWGLAKDLDERALDDSPDSPYRCAEPLTIGGIGTPQYMPPEQAAGEMADPRLDVYALGATLYHTLSGQLPYGDLSADGVLERLKTEAPKPLTEVAPGVPPELAAIVAKAMARKPARRYAGAAELAEELKRFQTGQLVSAHRYSVADLWKRWLRRHRAPVALAAIFVLLLGGVGTASVIRSIDAHHLSERQLSALLVERGERELADGHPSRALVYLNEALQHGADSAALRFLVGEASEPLRALKSTSHLDDDLATAAISANGERVVTTYNSKPAQIWDAATGEQFGELGTTAQSGGGFAPAFSPNGELILTYGTGGAFLWSATNGALVTTLTTAGVDWATFSGDGKHVAWVQDGSAMARNLSGTWRRKLDLDHLTRCVAVSPDGMQIVCGGYNQAAWIRNLDDGQLVSTLAPSGAAGVTAAAFDPSGEHVFVAWTNGNGVFDVATGRALETTTDFDYYTSNIRLMTDGRLLTVGVSRGAHFSTLDPATGKRRPGRELQHQSSRIEAADLADDGRLVTVALDGTVKVWTDGQADAEVLQDLPGARPVVVRVHGDLVTIVGRDGTVKTWRIPHGDSPIGGGGQSFVFDGHGRVLEFGACNTIWFEDHGVATESGGCKTSVWNLSTGRQVAAQNCRPPGAFTADGDHVICVADRRMIRWDLTSGAVEPLGEPLPPSEIRGISPDGQRVLTVNTNLLGGRLLDVTGRVIAALDATDLDLSPDGSFVSGVRADGAVLRWDAHSGGVLSDVKIAHVPPRAGDGFWPHQGDDGILFSAHGDRVVTTLTGEGQHVAVWDHDGRRLSDLQVGDNTGLLFSPAGDRLLTYNRDIGFGLWNVDTAAQVATLRAPTERQFTSAAFTPDGKLLVTTSNGHLGVWDAETGDLLVSRPTSDAVGVITISPDGTQALASVRAPDPGSPLYDLHQTPIDRAAIDQLVAKVPFRLDGARLVPRKPLP